MHRKFIYFINPVSGTGNKGLLLDIIKNKTTEKNIPFEILHTNAEGDYGFLKEKIATENITDIIVCGGDGTVNLVGRAGLKANIPVKRIARIRGEQFGRKGDGMLKKIRQIKRSLEKGFTLEDVINKKTTEKSGKKKILTWS